MCRNLSIPGRMLRLRRNKTKTFNNGCSHSTLSRRKWPACDAFILKANCSFQIECCEVLMAINSRSDTVCWRKWLFSPHSRTCFWTSESPPTGDPNSLKALQSWNPEPLRIFYTFQPTCGVKSIMKGRRHWGGKYSKVFCFLLFWQFSIRGQKKTCNTLNMWNWEACILHWFAYYLATTKTSPPFILCLKQTLWLASEGGERICTVSQNSDSQVE